MSTDMPDDRCGVSCMLRGIYATTRVVVVGACEQHQFSAARHRRIDPAQHATRGVTRNARIGDRDVVSLGMKQRLDPRWKGFARPNAIASGVASAERADLGEGRMDSQRQ